MNDEKKTDLEMVGDIYADVYMKISEYYERNKRVIERLMSWGDKSDLLSAYKTLEAAVHRPKAYYDQAWECASTCLFFIHGACKNFPDDFQDAMDMITDVSGLMDDAHVYRETAAREDIKKGKIEDFWPMISPEWYRAIKKEVSDEVAA